MQLRTTEEAFKSLGYTEWRSHQIEAVSKAETGQNGLIVIATGGGKSAIYQTMALRDSRMTIVISPLISLMLDQVKALKARGVKAEFLNSSLGVVDERNIEDRVLAGDVDLLYISPERLQNEKFSAIIRNLEIGLLVVDEAHCGLAWGYDFRPDYTRISSFVKTRPGMQVLAFTATATPKDRKDIVESLGMGNSFEVVTSCDRPNLQYNVVHCSKTYRAFEERTAVLFRLMGRTLTGPAIVYVSTTKHADELYRMLQGTSMAMNYTVLKYHGKMKDQERKNVSKTFIECQRPLVVATCAFGMGIDRADISQVYHFQIPKSLESYTQEVGRSGRSGEDCSCYLLYNKGDQGLLTWFVMQAAWPENAYKNLLKKIWKTNIVDLKKDCAGVSHLERAKLIEKHAKLRYHLTYPSLEDLYSSKPWKDLISWSSKYIATEMERIKIMVNYAETQNCRRSYILNHFGQTAAKSSRCCDRC